MAQISVIIPTLNPAPFDADFQSSLLPLLSPDIELIVIDSSSDPDKIQSHRTQATRFLSIPRSEFNHGGTRNRAAQLAQGDFLVFMTQDAIPAHPRCLAELVRPFADPKIAVTYGRQIPKPDAGPIEQFVRKFNYPDIPRLQALSSQPTLKTFFSSNVFSCYRKSAFWEVGGFPDHVILNEDMLINSKLMKRGFTCQYVPSASVIHSHNYSIQSQFQRYFDIGTSIRDHWDIFEHVEKGSDGKQLAVALQLHLIKTRQWGAFMKSFFDIGARYLGFKLGLFHRHLPVSLKKRLSMHRFFWDA